MNITIGPLESFYIAGAILLLAIAIVAYPTLRAKNESKKSAVKRKS